MVLETTSIILTEGPIKNGQLGMYGYVNKQNCRSWSEDQPEAMQKLPNHPEKVTVWCGLCAGGFKDAANRNVTMNGERYREMLSNFFLSKMQQLDLHDIWFQQDSTTCYTTRITMDLF